MSIIFTEPLFFYDDFINILEESRKKKKAGLIKESLLDLSIRQGDEYSADIEDLSFDWNITEAEGRTIKIQLVFDKPNFVSAGRHFDKMQVKLLTDITYFDMSLNSVEENSIKIVDVVN